MARIGGGYWAPSRTPRKPISEREAWHIEHLGLAQVWPITRGAGTRLAILDSGVADVSGLEGRVTWLRPDGTPDYGIDNHGHGTRCAVLAASGDETVRGVAPECEVISIRVTSSTGDPDGHEVARAFELLVGRVDVISCSFVLKDASPRLQDAIRSAFQSGAFIVAAAGNSNAVASAFPERTPHVFTVSAIARDGEPLKGCRIGPWIDVAAAGENLLTRSERGKVTDDFGKTSGATALVAGVAVLAMSLDPSAEHRRALSQVLGALIQETASDIGPKGRDEFCGAGAINPPALIARVSKELSIIGGKA